MLKQPIYYEFNLDARTSPSKLIAISHVDDKYSEVLEVAVKQNDRFVYMGGATVIARMVLHRDKDYLLSDDVACSVNDNGNILIPFDNAVVKTLQGVVKIEVNITRDTDELTLQFPLWVSVTGSILDNAEVTPESEGTIPYLLKEAADALEDATKALEQLGSYNNLEDKPQINGVTLSGNKTSDVLGVAGWKIEAIDNCIEDGVLYSTQINNQAAYVLARNITTDITQYAFCRDGRVMWRTRQAETQWQPAGEWSAWEDIGGSEIASGVVNQNGTITFFDENGDPLFTTTGESVIGPKGDNGDTGAAGADGYSPTVSTTNLDAQTLVTVTDKNGAHNFYVKDGSSVTNAVVDENGDLIISIQQKPTSSVHPTIHTLEVNAGHVVGAAGAKGDKGDKGDPGNDYVLTSQDKTDIAGMVDISGKADKATTLAGYGITDAYTKTQADTLLNAKESTVNKVTAVNSSASDTQYPSAKAVYDFGANILNDVAEEVGDLKSAMVGTLDYTLTNSIDLLRLIKWKRGSYVDNANGAIVANQRFYCSDMIPLAEIGAEYHVVATGSNTLKMAQYDSDGEFITGSGFSIGSAYNTTKTFHADAAFIKVSVGAWSGSLSLTDYCDTISVFVNPKNDVIKNEFLGYHQIVLTKDTYIRTPAVGTRNVPTTQNTLNGCASVAIPCSKGDIVNITGTPRDDSGTRPIIFLNSANTCIFRSDATTAFSGYEYCAPDNGTLVVNLLTSATILVYTGLKDLSKEILTNRKNIETIETATLDAMPEFIINAMANRPFGTLKQPYICLTCDDGAAELASYTIPMLLDKDVPCTFGLWASVSSVGASQPFNKSVILQSAEGISTLESALSNGCKVAQHGPHEWTEMTNAELNDFFNREKTAWDALGITVNSAICPSHCINNKVRVIAGGRFGVVRSGYKGYKSKADQQAIINGDVYAEYSYYCTGARSNVFGLTSFNTNAVTLAWMKKAVDYAIAQNMLLVVYWHDWDLTAQQKVDLEEFIDYAKAQSITFVTLGEIPTLV